MKAYDVFLAGNCGPIQVVTNNDHVSLVAGTIDGEEFSMLELARFLRGARHEQALIIPSEVSHV